MIFHSFLVGGLGEDFDGLSRFGWAGVDLFFVLSGFLIGTQLMRPLQRGEALSVRAFYVRRAWRILPAFAVVLALYVVFPSLREVPGMQPGWQFATFTLNLLIDASRNPAFSHAWSLCVEEHFYLVFPLLAMWLARRASAPRIVGLCIGIVLAGLALRCAVWLHDTALDPPRNWFLEDLYYPSWTRLDGLMAGVMLALVRVFRPQAWSRWQARPNLFVLGGLATSALALWLFRDRTGLLANTLGWPVLSLGFGLLVVAGSAARGLLGGWRMPGVTWIAAISYSLYLSHKIAFHIVHAFIAPTLGLAGPVLFLVYALATLLIGASLHGLVERPFLRWRDRLARAPGPSRNTAAAPQG